MKLIAAPMGAAEMVVTMIDAAVHKLIVKGLDGVTLAPLMLPLVEPKLLPFIVNVVPPVFANASQPNHRCIIDGRQEERGGRKGGGMALAEYWHGITSSRTVSDGKRNDGRRIAVGTAEIGITGTGTGSGITISTYTITIAW